MLGKIKMEMGFWPMPVRRSTRWRSSFWGTFFFPLLVLGDIKTRLGPGHDSLRDNEKRRKKNKREEKQSPEVLQQHPTDDRKHDDCDDADSGGGKHGVAKRADTQGEPQADRDGHASLLRELSPIQPAFPVAEPLPCADQRLHTPGVCVRAPERGVPAVHVVPGRGRVQEEGGEGEPDAFRGRGGVSCGAQEQEDGRQEPNEARVEGDGARH